MDEFNNCTKIDLPHIGKIYKRAALFKKFDKEAQTPALWVSAPPGAGKTTLGRSYLTHTKSNPIWFQVDEGDSDIASFFYHLRLAGLKASPNDQTPLPLLSPEYSFGLNTFSRNFFRGFYRCIGGGNTLVFDNYQDMEDNPFLHELISIAIEENTKGNKIIFISRTAPPAAFARALANQPLVEFGWDDLQLQADESRAIALSHNKNLNEETINSLFQKSDGWAAGLLLLLRDPKLSENALLPNQSISPTLFNYFATQSYESFDHEEKIFLQKTAFYPVIETNISEDSTSNNKLDTFLNKLVENSFFTQKVIAKRTGYRYHPLFQDFLKTKTKSDLSESEFNELINHSAKTLTTNNHYEDAISLYITNNNWKEIIHILKVQGEKLIQQGRYDSLSNWLSSIPRKELEQNPELLSLFAQVNQTKDPQLSFELYDKALKIHLSKKEIIPLFHCWCCGMDFLTFISRDPQSISLWLERYDEISPFHTKIDSPEIAARITASIFGSLAIFKTEDSRLPQYADATEDLLKAPLYPTVKLQLGALLIFHRIWWEGNYERARIIYERLEIVAESFDNSPLAKIFWFCCKSIYLALNGKKQDCIDAIQDGLRYANESGIHLLDSLLLNQGVYIGLYANDIKLCERYQKQLSNIIPHASSALETSQYYFSMVFVNLKLGKTSIAAQNVIDTTRESDVSTATFPMLWAQVAAIQSDLVNNDFEIAQSKLTFLQNTVENIHTPTLKLFCNLNQAYIYLKTNIYEQATSVITHTFKDINIGAVKQISPWVTGTESLLENIFLYALEHNIETSNVLSVLDSLDASLIKIPQITIQWNWPVRIYTFDRLRIEITNNTETQSRKTEHRPLELLQVLLSNGRTGLVIEQAVEVIFPDIDLARANKSFATTLYRLRKKLQHKNAVITESGRIFLNDQVCWVDAWALEDLITQNRKTKNIPPLRTALALYKGSYLPAGFDNLVISQKEEEYRRLFINATITLANHSEEQALWNEALDHYYQALKLEPMEEVLYQKIANCYNSLGRHTDAKSVSDRYVQLLNEDLGLNPSIDARTLVDI